MNRDEFIDPRTGTFVAIESGLLAFVPAPLTRGLAVPHNIAKQVGDTRSILGRLNEGVRVLPRPDAFLRPFQKREAVLSSRIEGTVTTLDEAFLSAAVSDNENLVDDAREVRNYELALRAGVEGLRHGRNLNVSLLKELHRHLLTGVRGEDKQPGEVRTRQAFVANRTVQVQTDARFVPPPPLNLPDCLEHLDSYLADRECDEALLRIAFTHYQFETIHPFADGNGRTGRLLIALQMVWEKVLDEPFLYVSPALERRRQDYYDGLLRVSQQGSFMAWAEFFLASVAHSATETLDRLHRLRALSAEFAERLSKKQSQKPGQLAKELLAYPYMSVSLAARLCGWPTTTAQKTITELQKVSILSVLTRVSIGRGRPTTIYRCDEVLEIMKE